jgi:hypothetical protein
MNVILTIATQQELQLGMFFLFLIHFIFFFTLSDVLCLSIFLQSKNPWLMSWWRSGAHRIRFSWSVQRMGVCSSSWSTSEVKRGFGLISGAKIFNSWIFLPLKIATYWLVIIIFFNFVIRLRILELNPPKVKHRGNVTEPRQRSVYTNQKCVYL